MRLRTLRLRNFRQHADTTVTFDGGLTGIIGANGSGKSTLLEAIAWALYGTAAARGTKDSIRFQRAGARAPVSVSLEFELGGHRYRVERGLTSAECYLDGGTAPIATSVLGVTELLQRRLGMTREEFFHTYFTGQKELDVMAAMTPAERGQFLSRVLGYERLRAAQELVRDRRRGIVAEATALRGAMRDPDALDAEGRATAARVAAAHRGLAEATGRASAAAATLADVGPRHEAQVARRERHLARDAERRELAAEADGLAQLEARNARDAAEVAAAAGELGQVAAQLAALPAALEAWREAELLAREDGRRRALQQAEHGLAAEQAVLEERRAKVASAPALEAEVGAQLQAARLALAAAEAAAADERTAYDRDRQEAETQRQALRQQYAELQAQREAVLRLGAEGACPTCRRALGESYRAVLDALDQQLEAVGQDGRYYKARVEQLQAEPEGLRGREADRRGAAQALAALERKLARVQAAVQELATLEADLAAKAERRGQAAAELAAIPGGHDPARHAALRGRLDALTALEARAARLGAVTEREAGVREERERIEQRRVALAARRAALASAEGADAWDADAFAASAAAHASALAAQRASELALVAARGEHAAATEAAARLEAERLAQAEARARLEGLAEDRRLHDELDAALADLRTDLNAALRPELSELASTFLSDLTDGRYAELELDDAYALVVREDGVPKPVISGGEEDLANLVLRLAISQMIAERAGQPFSLLVLDEVFGSLDAVRREHVLGLLRRLHDRFEQVIVITHIEDVREGLDRVLEVRLDPETGASTVVDPAAAPAVPGVGEAA